MFGSDVVEALIGLLLIYFLFSVLCSALNEWALGHLCDLRARTFKRGIQQMLGSANASIFFRLPIVRSFATLNRTKFSKDDAREASPPSYLSNSSFVDALMALVAENTKKEVSELAGNVAKLYEAVQSLDEPGNPLLTQNHIRENKDLKAVLSNLVGGAKDIAEARKKIELWFEEGMNRATGWYKRKNRWHLLAVAVVVTLVFNVDSLRVMGELMNNSKLRAVLAASAEQAARVPLSASNSVEEAEKKIRDLQLPIGWGKRVSVVENDRIFVESGWYFAPTNSTYSKGWSFSKRMEYTVPASGTIGPPLPWHDNWGSVRESWMGWLITAVALSLGAPFWFDLMSKVVSLRSSSKKPDTTKPEENPKKT